jgi:hypothetical protein
MKTTIHLAATLAIVFFVCVPRGMADHSERVDPQTAAEVEPVKSLSSISLASENANGPAKSLSGAVQVYNGAAAGSSENVGDINLNGVPNEVADAVLYSKYFIYGLQVFRIDQSAQIMQTDVNVDGLPLSMSDLVYQINVINEFK